MASFDPFAVQISYFDGDQHKILGSGAVVAPRGVLTARHILKAADCDLRVRLNAKAEPLAVAERRLPDDADLDIALLLVSEDLIGPSEPPARLQARSLRNAEDWAASGYPAVVKDKPSVALHSVAGQTLPTAVDAELCPVDVRRGPHCWAGLSGAAVRVGEEVVAVLRSVPTGWDGGRLNATPVGRFINAPWFLNALGLGDAQQALQDEAAKLIEEIRALIAPYAQLRDSLKLALGATSEDAAALARALVGCQADQVVRALNDADEELDERKAPPGDREALWVVLERVLPYAIDWRPTITRARQRVLECRCISQPEPNEFELSCRTETVAEIVLAGVDGRRCAFVPLDGGRRLSGVGFLCWPAASAAPLRQTPELVREATVQKLASELGVQQGAWVVERLAEATETPLTGAAEGIVGEIEARLAAALQSRRASPRRRHLLVIDDELGGPEAGLAAWQVVQAALGSRLPSLRLVRLTGSPAQRGPETSIAAPIEALYKARNSR